MELSPQKLMTRSCLLNKLSNPIPPPLKAWDGYNLVLLRWIYISFSLSVLILYYNVVYSVFTVLFHVVWCENIIIFCKCLYCCYCDKGESVSCLPHTLSLFYKLHSISLVIPTVSLFSSHPIGRYDRGH